MSKIRKYHNHKPQTPPWHREEELLNHHETPGRSKIANRVSGVEKANANTTLPFANRKEELCSTLKQSPFIMMQRIYKIMQFCILDAAPSTKVLLKTTITNVNSSDSTAEAHILLMRGHRGNLFRQLCNVLCDIVGETSKSSNKRVKQRRPKLLLNISIELV